LILDGTSPEARTLQEQTAVALVSERVHTGRGFCVWFDVPEFAPRLNGRSGADIVNLAGRVEGRDGAGCDAYFILHVRNREITMLECIGSGPTWPENPQLTNHYYNQRGRDGLILR
jgi:hypothetical protein